MTTTTTLLVPDPDEPAGTGEVVDLDGARDRRVLEPAPDASGRLVAADGDAPPGPEVDESDPAGRPAPIDPPDPPRPGITEVARSAQLRPILPKWARSAEQFRHAARWVARHYAHRTGYHAVRLPVYAARLAGRSPRGAWRVVGGFCRWVADTEGLPVRLAAVRREDPETYIRLSRQRDARVRVRTAVAFPVVFATAAGAVFVAVAPALTRFGVLVGLVAVLGLAGRRADRPLLSGAVVTSGVAPKLTADVVVLALSSLGIAQINRAVAKGGSGIGFVAPITRDGPGWRADIDLPPGVTVADIMERRTSLASGLRRPVGCVWPEPAADAHAGRLVLWVGDQDMAKAPAAEWPLARRGTADLFAAVPVGTDPRGRWVPVPFMENNVLIGALPGGGKTATARVYMLAAALDPTAEVWVFNLKNNNDWAAAAKIAHRYAVGLDDMTVEQVVQALRDLKAEIGRRSSQLRKLPLDLCPDGKVTRQLANRRGLGLHPLTVFIDECQNLFSHPTYGKEAGELAEYVIKLGRALGVFLLLATQRPDSKSLPTGVSANVSVRFCLRVMGQIENDMVLGTSMYQNGIRATTFRPTDKGIGYLVGAADEPLIVRGAYIDIPTSDRIADRARAARVAAGTLGGYAAGQDTLTAAAPAASVLDDLVAVLPAAESKAHSVVLAGRLADLRPDVYAGWGAEQISAALKPFAVPTRQVWVSDPPDGGSPNRTGVHRDDILSAIAERDRKRAAS